VLFGLTRKELLPIVQKVADGEAVTSFQISLDELAGPGFPGARGDKVVLTFNYVTSSGRHGESALFVKRQCDADSVEGFHYACLEELGATVPRMYGAPTAPDGRELLFLELLNPLVPDFAEFATSKELLRDFVALTAHFNAIRPSRRYAEQLTSQDWGRNLETAAVMLGRILRLSGEGNLGEQMRRFCESNQEAVKHLRALALRLAPLVDEMETGLCRRDNNPTNAARRPGTGELVFVDLEMVQLMPRFWDAAQLLGQPDEFWGLALPRSELVEWYLKHYAYHGGRPPDPRQFLMELRILWMTRQLADLWWRLERTQPQAESSRPQQLEENREQLRRLLTVLVRQASQRDWPGA